VAEKMLLVFNKAAEGFIIFKVDMMTLLGQLKANCLH
jgi:hypothetical protein